MWVEFVGGSCPGSKGFLGLLQVPQKPTFQIPKQPGTCGQEGSPNVNSSIKDLNMQQVFH